jgi:hypothetical protein
VLGHRNRIKVWGPEGHEQMVDITDATDSNTIMSTILYSFKIHDDMEKYSLFTVAGEVGKHAHTVPRGA